MKVLKKIKMDMWINVCITILLGLLFVIKPQGSLRMTAVLAGIMICCNGIFDLIYYIWSWTDTYFIRGLLFEGILKCVLGIFMFTHADVTSVLFSYIFSIYIVFNGIICMETAISIRKIFHENGTVYMILSGIVILGGLGMMLFSPDTVKTAAQVTGVIFLTNGVVDAIMLYQIHKIGKKFKGKIQYMIDDLNGNIIDENSVR